jgi:UDP-N-acetylglucosamine--N-acetylmuramyl-(pentapeptide) pyrophosphoryl-undecaprenol N-acetylglucosamine transferase
MQSNKAKLNKTTEQPNCPDCWPKVNVVIAGGGTGGHLFPGIALAQEFMARNARSKILFIGSGRPLEKKTLPRLGFDLKTISIEGLKDKGWWQRLKAGLKIPAAVLTSAAILFRFKPQIIIGVGGYSAGPVITAAWIMRKRRTLHEQNTIPGITNRILARLVDRCYVSFDDTKGLSHRSNTRICGNPIRKEILAAAAPSLALSDTVPKGPAQTFTVAVVGGSQGAHAINMAVENTLPHLLPKERFYFIHQTGTEDEAALRKAYDRVGIRAVVHAFFDDMAGLYRQADLLICRAGATTVAELTVLGKPAVFVPYPYAADNHQEKNAETMVNAGMALMIRQKELSGTNLAGHIRSLADQPGRLAEMAKNAILLGRPKAAEAIVDDCYRLMVGKGSLKSKADKMKIR